MELKKFIFISLSLLMLLQCSIKTLIVVSYYTNKNYISNVLCENKKNKAMHCEGKCYLKKQLKKQSDSTTNIITLLKNIETATPQLQQLLSIGYTSNITFVQHHFSYLLKPYESISSSPLQPPRFSA